MALITHPGARMVLSLLATAAAVLAGLLLLANLLMSGAYAGRVPTGADAMGLVVPLALAAVAALLLPAAAGLLLANGRLAWLGGLGGWKVLVLMLGVGVAAGAVLIAWMERLGAWVMPLGLFCGVVAPLAAIALLLASAWRDGAVLQPAVVDIPGKNEMVKGAYKVPSDAGTIRVKITDLLSESWEGSVSNGN